MISAKAIQKRVEQPDGKERIVCESLHYGVGKSAYTYREDAQVAGLEAGVDFTEGRNPLFVHLTKSGLVTFCHAMNTLAYFCR